MSTPSEKVQLRKALLRIAELEDWVKSTGYHSDICTYWILKKTICDSCRCERKLSNKEKST